MRQPVDGWLERDGVDLHYLEWQPARVEALDPPIVLLHGLSSNARFWVRVAQHIPDRRVIALDQRGHGLTGRKHPPALPRGFEMAELVGDVRALSEQLGLSNPVVVGHSWGATVALHVATSQPAFTSGLVFVDGPLQNFNRVFGWEQAQQSMQPPLPRYRSLDQAIADSRRDFMQAWGDDLLPFVEARVMPDGDGLALTLTEPIRLELLRGIYFAKPEELWPKVHPPALALVGEHVDPRIARYVEDGVERLRAIAPQVTVKLMDSPHDIPLHLPAQVAAEIESITAAAGALS